MNNMNQESARGGNQSFGEKDDALFTLFENNMDYPGWKIKNKNNE